MNSPAPMADPLSPPHALVLADWDALARTAPALTHDCRAPIGLFDSGVGGLTVLAAVQRRLPIERLVYIADQAHVPYGSRPLEEVRGLAGSLTHHLLARGAKAVVMACNISSATLLEAGRATFGAERVLGMIEPGAQAARATTQRGVVGVLATEGTVRTQAYPRALRALEPGLSVIQMACPRFVPLVEAQATESADAHAAAEAYLTPLIDAGADTVILGCTHYPFLRGALERIADGRVTFVDPAEALAQELEATLMHAGLLADTSQPTPPELITTGSATSFERQLRTFLPGVEAEVAALPWQGGIVVPG